ncbi:GNAT family N-acetyltransferase [Acidaminobacter sp. JC074]|uniref:GNAT family N-acetyltransferase n=1 Tax=Acidaminobacter sp. JC074 TaxID=2530199 RepID=UPI001F0D6677|nr:GNAT family N-acetyltransferase [Acidaminobacter sp. JC074]MCH4888290.1 GNAT family N-acetyltransferase [Acidaminobacter sp. JC074]
MIRRAIIEDFLEIYNMDFKYIKSFEPEDLSRWLDAKEHILKGYEDNLDSMFVFEEESILGFAYWSIHEDMPCVFSIYVDESSRGRGIGQKLMLSLEESVQIHGYDRMTLSTRLINPAQHLFDKMAYKRLAIKDDWIQYEKRLK